MCLLSTDQRVPDGEPLGAFRILGVLRPLRFDDVVMPQKALEPRDTNWVACADVQVGARGRRAEDCIAREPATSHRVRRCVCPRGWNRQITRAAVR
jgi:hypothetical protein